MKLIGNLKLCAGISCALIAIALIMNVMGLGVNMGIDFAGGMIITYDLGGEFEVADVEAALTELGVTEMQVSKSAESGGAEVYANVRLKSMENAEVEAELRGSLEDALREKYPDVSTTATDYVGAVAGRELVWNAVQALLIATVLMLLYIAVRFDFFSGVAAVIGLVHDVLIMIAFMTFFRGMVQVNSPFIAALLTIVGYSINNTIVIFDRIRENQKRGGYRERGRMQLVEDSVRQSLSRTISTSITTLLTIVTLYILGVDSIREFAFPIIIGILSGIYSSNLINGPVWTLLLEQRAKRAKNGKKKTRTMAI